MLQVYFLLSVHITMCYKEYYKLTQLDQAVYGSIESIEIHRQNRNKTKTKTKTHTQKKQQTDKLVIGARCASQRFDYNTNK